MKRFVLMLVALGAFGLVLNGCAKKDEAAAGDDTAAAKPAEGDEAKEEAKEEEAKEEEATEEEGTEEAAGDLGVPECDEYIGKYMACVESKVPEAARAQMTEAFAKTKDAWKQAASTDEGKKALAEGCKQALEQAKTAMKQFECEW